MKRIDTKTAVLNMHGPNKPGFRDGDAINGIKPTYLNAAFMNALQEEIANAIEKSGMNLDPNDNSQLYAAIQRLARASVDSVEELRQFSGLGVVNVAGYYKDSKGFGGGVFYSDVNDNESADNGGTIIVSVDGVRWRRLLDGVCRFSDFGVLPGKENAPTTLNKINALFKFVYEAKIPKVLNDVPGDYYLNGLIRIGDNLEFESVDGVRYLRNTSGAMLYNGLVINDNSSRENPCRNITIIGGEFNSNAKEQWSSVNFFSLGYIHNLTVRGVKFVNCIRNHAIDLSACENVLIEDCEFLGFNKEVTTVYGTAPGATHDRGYAEAIQIDDNVEGTFTGGRLKGDPCINVTIRNNHFGKNPDDDTGLFGQGYGVAVGGHYAARGVQHRSNIKILNNIIEDCGYAGIRPFLWDNVKINGNTFKNCRRNIYIWWLDQTNNPSEAGKDYDISGNIFGDTVAEQILTQIFGNQYTGDYAKLSNLDISHNNFGRTEWAGPLIKLQGVDKAIVTANVFDVGTRFIDVEYSSRVLISENVGNGIHYEFMSSKNNIYDGVVGQSSEVYVINNIAGGSRGGALYLQKMRQVTVQGNRFFNIANTNKINSIRVIEVDDLVCNDNTVMLAASAVAAGVAAIDVDASCSGAQVGAFVTNSEKVCVNRSSSTQGIDLWQVDVDRAVIDSARINALTVGRDGSMARNLVVNGSMSSTGEISAKTPPASENSTVLATTEWVRQLVGKS